MNLIRKKYNFSIKKIIFIITPGELNRNIWNFNDQQLRCLKDHTKCIGTENIYGYDFNLSNEKKFAEQIYAIKGGERNSFKPFLNALNQGNYFQAIKELAKNSYLIKKLYLSLFKSKSMLNSGEENFEAIKKIVKLNKNKVFILHPNNRGQTDPEESELVVKLVKNLNLKNYYFYCQIPPIKGFHKNDSHPNKLGYSKLKNCLVKLLNN